MTSGYATSHILSDYIAQNAKPLLSGYSTEILQKLLNCVKADES